MSEIDVRRNQARTLAQGVVGEGKPLPPWVERRIMEMPSLPDPVTGKPQTVRATTFGFEDGTHLVPTIRDTGDGKLLQLVDDEEIIREARDRGDSLVFPSEVEAQQFYRELTDILEPPAPVPFAPNAPGTLGRLTLEQLRDTAAISAHTNPDRFARAFSIAERQGVSISTVDADFERWEHRDALDHSFAPALIGASPRLQQWLSDSEIHRRIAWDDTEALSMFERTMERGDHALEVGKDLLRLSNLGVRRMAGETISPDELLREREMEQRIHDLGGPDDGALTNAIEGAIALLPFIERTGRGSATGAAILAPLGAVTGVPLGPPGVAAGGTAGGATGAIIGAIKAVSDVEKGLAYNDYRRRGMDHETARDAAEAYGVVSGSLEVGPLALAWRALKMTGALAYRAATGKELTRLGLRDGIAVVVEASPTFARSLRRTTTAILSTGLVETGEEAAQAASQELIGQIAGDEAFQPDKIAGAAFEEGAAAIGPVMVLAVAGVTVAGTLSAAAKGAQIAESRFHRERLEARVRAATESKLRERSREGFESFAARVVAESETVQIPAERMVEYFQGEAPTREALEATSAGDQLSDALAVGGDVILPTREYLAHLGPEHHEGLKDDVRVGAGTFTAREEEAALADLDAFVEQLKQEEAETLETASAMTEISNRAVEAGFEAPHAALLAARFIALAHRRGVDAVELATEQMPTLLLSGEIPPLPTAVARQIRTLAGQLREGREPETKRLQRQPLLARIKRMGGVEPDSPLAVELEHMGATRTGEGRVRGLFRTGGVTDFDRVAENLSGDPLVQTLTLDEFGRADIAQLREAIDEELRGRPLRTPDEIEAINEKRLPREELAAALERLGVDLKTATDEDILEAIAVDAFNRGDEILFQRTPATEDADQAAALARVDVAVEPVRTEGIRAAEENWAGGLANFGDHQAAVQIQQMAGYFDYRSSLHESLRSEFGDALTVHRLMDTRQIEAWRGGDDIGPVSTTLRSSVAQGFNKFAQQGEGTRTVVTFEVPVESVVMMGALQEAELVVDLNEIEAPREDQTLFQSAFHGGPFDFDKFDLTQIGTGEGAQAFGWGLYFASERGVAEFYREAGVRDRGLERSRIAYDGKTYGDDIDSLFLDHVSNIARLADREGVSDAEATQLYAAQNEERRARAQTALQEATEAAESTAAEFAQIDIDAATRALTAVENIDPAKITRPPAGQTFEVNLPDDENLLDWDMPLSEQHPDVTAKLAQLEIDDVNERLETGSNLNPIEPADPDYTGAQLYQAMSSTLNAQEASEALASVGILGHKYLDQQSRLPPKSTDTAHVAAARNLRETGASREDALEGLQASYPDASTRDLTGALIEAGYEDTEATHNFVIYDDRAIEVVRKFYQAQSGGPPRGSIRIDEALRNVVIQLGEGADLSTTIHELGHLFFTQLQRGAEEGISEDEVDDWNVTLAWLGRETSDTAPLSREESEKLAQAFELYAREGKAPSVELRRVFATFRAWLMQIYETLRGFKIELSDEFRAVMDRMLATDEAIANVQDSAAGLTDEDAAGLMTDEELQAWNAATDTARNAARNTLDRKLLGDIRRQRSAEWQRNESAMRDEVSAEIRNEPGYVLRHWLQRGEFLDGRPFGLLPHAKLSRDGVVSIAGPEMLTRLATGPNGFWQAEGGYHPDELAHVFGFDGGDSLLEALLETRNRDDEIKAEAHRRMIDEHGDLLETGSIAEEAVAAWQGEEAARVLLIEERAIARRTGQQATPTRVAREAAERIVLQTKLHSMHAGRARQKQRAAALRVAEALAVGDFAGALEAKRQEVLQFYIARELDGMRRKTDAAHKRLRKYRERQTQARVGKAGGTFLHQILKLLSRFQLRAMPLEPIEIGAEEREQTLSEWIEIEESENETIAPIHEDLRSDAFATHHKNLTVEQFLALDDAVRFIAKMARKKLEYSLGSIKAMRDDMAAEMRAEADAVHQRKPKRHDTPDAYSFDAEFVLDKLKNIGQAFDASLLKMEVVAAWLAGAGSGFREGNPRSLWYRAVVEPLFDAWSAREKMLETFSDRLSKRILEHAKETGSLSTWKRYEPLVDPRSGRGFQLNRWGLISIALNLGNASNRKKLVDGYQWDFDVVKGILDRELSDGDWRFLQDVWNLMDELREPAFALEERQTGIRPPAIQAMTLDTPIGKVKGGYYPVRYDPKRSPLGLRNQIEQDANRMRFSGYARATTGHGHLTKRTNVVAPIWLSPKLIQRHFDQSITDLTMRETFDEVTRLLSHPDVDAAIRENLGDAFTFQEFWNPKLKQVTQDIGGTAGMEAWDWLFRGLRKNATMAKLFLKTSVMAIQPSGHFNSVQQLRQHLPANAEFYWGWGVRVALGNGHPRLDAWSLSLKEITEVSDFMRSRPRSITRDSHDIIHDAMANRAFGWAPTNLVRDFQAFAAELLGRFQWITVDYPTWLAAYRGIMQESRVSHTEAVKFADRIVRISQAGGDKLSQSRVELGGNTGNEFFKAGLLFYSFANAVWNQERTAVHQQRYRDVPATLATLFLVASLPGLASFSIYATLYDKWPDPEDDDFELEMLKVLGKSTTRDMVGGVPVVRDGIEMLYGEAPRPASAIAVTFRDIQAIRGSRDDFEMMLRTLRLLSTLGGIPIDEPLRFTERQRRESQR